MRILIVKTSAIGDVIHTLPALHALRSHFPDAHIAWLVEEAAADVVKGHPAIDRVLVSRRKTWAKALRHHPRQVIGEAAGFVREIRAARYDLLIDFQNLLKSGIFVGLARADRKVGYGRGMEHSECSYLFLNERIPPVDMDQHAVVRELKLLEAVGVPCREIRFDFPVGEAARRQVDRLLAELAIDPGKPLVAINPQATWNTKLWLNERFAQVADALIEGGCEVLFTGAPGDRPVIEAILAAMRHRAGNLAGQTTLKMLAALYERSDVVVSTDTGPMHVAAAVETPVVALFGPTSARRTGPYGNAHKVLRAGLPCSPCFRKQCDSGSCMAWITVEMVAGKVFELTDRLCNPLVEPAHEKA